MRRITVEKLEGRVIQCRCLPPAGARGAAARGVRLRRWRRRGRMDAPPQRGGVRGCRADAAAAQWRGRAGLSVSCSASQLSMPVMIGPTGLAGLFWPGGEGARRAPRAAAAPPIASATARSAGWRSWPRSARPRAGCRSSSIRDRQFTWELADRAAAAGYDALVLTIDNQLLGNRERDMRNGFAIPPRFERSDMPRWR